MLVVVVAAVHTIQAETMPVVVVVVVAIRVYIAEQLH
jgi:hypothetical protein